MSERITAANLDEVIKRNEVIEEQMKQSASLIWSKYNPMQINSPIQLALQILRPYGLIQLPIDNRYLSGAIFVRDAPNGFENIRAVLAEYVHRAEKKQQDMTEHEKCLTNGTYERARESGTEQNYDMIDGCVNNVPKKPRRIDGRWSVLDRLHIKQAQRKQKDQTQQQQERSRKN